MADAAAVAAASTEPHEYHRSAEQFHAAPGAEFLSTGDRSFHSEDSLEIDNFAGFLPQTAADQRDNPLE